MSNFLPDDYNIPQGKSKYYKLEKGLNKFRIVSRPIIGYLYWNTENKPVRMKEYPDSLPLDIRVEANESPESNIKHFWAMTILDRKENAVKVFEITQKSIMKSMKALFDDNDWGDPTGYDVAITKEGDKLTTKYEVNPSPPKKLTGEEKELVSATPVDLEELYSGGDPFHSEKEAPETNEDVEEIRIEDIPL